MPDLLVSLYSPTLANLKRKTDTTGIRIRPALPPEMHVVVEWVRQNFSENWASEVSVAFSRQPIACLIAVEGGKHLWVGENQTRRVLTEIVAAVNPSALPLATHWPADD